MKNIKDLFVSYEIAKQLKEKGFDAPCLIMDNEQGEDATLYYEHENGLPTYQQVTDYLREKGIDIVIERVYGSVNYSGKIIKSGRNGGEFSGSFIEYYDTLNRAIEEALKLI